MARQVNILSLVDSIIVGLYLLGIVAIGLATRGRQKDADDYFMASGMMSGWFGTLLVGLSLALFSGVSFLFYPAVVYNGGIVLFIGVALVSMPAAYFVAAVVLAALFEPRRNRAVWNRSRGKFGPATRTVASILYMLMRIGWMAALDLRSDHGHHGGCPLDRPNGSGHVSWSPVWSARSTPSSAAFAASSSPMPLNS